MNRPISEELRRELEKLTEPELQIVLRYVKNIGSSTPRGVDWPKLEALIGSIPSENLREMERIIEEGCEKIDEEGW